MISFFLLAGHIFIGILKNVCLGQEICEGNFPCDRDGIAFIMVRKDCGFYPATLDVNSSVIYLRHILSAKGNLRMDR